MNLDLGVDWEVGTVPESLETFLEPTKPTLDYIACLRVSKVEELSRSLRPKRLHENHMFFKRSSRHKPKTSSHPLL
jgi:hypothetical protein